MNALIQFLSCKYEIDHIQIGVENLLRIAELEHITIDTHPLLDEAQVPSEAILCYGEGDKKARHPVLFVGENAMSEKNMPSFWFKLAHEIGHFFLHPFRTSHKAIGTQPNGTSLDDMNSDEISIDLEKLRGVADKEADYFATIAFIPTKELDQTFLTRAMNALLEKIDLEAKSDVFENCKDENLEAIKLEVCKHIENKTKNLISERDIYPKEQVNKGKARRLSFIPARNIMLRAAKYVHDVEERIIIIFGEYPRKITEDYLDSFLKINEISDPTTILSLVENAYYHYNHKWTIPGN